METQIILTEQKSYFEVQASNFAGSYWPRASKLVKLEIIHGLMIHLLRLNISMESTEVYYSL